MIPKCLKIIESYKNEEKSIGFKTLKMIFNRTNKDDIIWFDELLIKILYENMVFREINVIESSIPCVIQLLKIIEKEKHFEYFLKEFFNSLQYLNNNEQRTVYLLNLNEIFLSIGILSTKYFKKIFKILLSEEYLNSEIMKFTIKCIETISKECWPRMTKKLKVNIIKTLNSNDYQKKNELEIKKIEILFSNF